MFSWQIYRHLNIFNHHAIEQHPVYRRESGRVFDWTRYTESVVRVLIPAAGIFAVLYLLLSWLDSPLVDILHVVLYWAILMLALVPSLAPWALPIGVLIGPSVAEEHERRTWAILRVIPSGIAPLLLAKMRAGLWPLRHPLHVLRHLWLVMALIVAFGLLQASRNAWGSTLPLHLPVCAPWEWTTIASVLLLAAGVIAFFADRVQQVILMVLAALAVSTTARSSQWALVGAVVAAFLAWALETASAVVLVRLLPGTNALRALNIAGLMVLGPFGGFAIDLPLASVLTGMTLMLAGREIAIRVLWCYTLRAAIAE